ncbi:glutamate synthase-related protein [Thermoflavimicrobium dichotomicum]|uniref:Glutamate synthase (NADPH/NADH) large chain n=1 Tax=Thermoflavimicrobium dichotomicum TaxID=46223 RepID=A0A1I3JCI3_9BACL|nr:glutamate synthase-related protein [Thermoflavimicrobium dichotomicum]SFI57957.1 glutamate synthase (NADPH/NADH) large chain [Thermoflavimicrobium dichotomicum]
MSVPFKKADLGRFRHLTAAEHDSCGIIATIEKDGIPKRANILDTIHALIKMEHRSGFIHDEGDGCGILTDLPRDLWAKYLSQNQLARDYAYQSLFAVAHIFLRKQIANKEEIQAQIRNTIQKYGLTILLERLDQVNSSVLGKNGKKDEPHFWQIACLAESEENLSRRLFNLVVELEEKFPVQVASFSNQTVIYKVMGAAHLLTKYFDDLSDADFKTIATIGHNRYSTNTASSFFRVQPFSLLGHNGEINTVRKLRDEAMMIGTPLAENSSDSQDLNRLLETLIHHYDFTLLEAIEMVFPPVIHELKLLPDELKDLYSYYRQVWGPFVQGPVALVSRYENECAFHVDALGLRPLWLVESERCYFFSSEQGIISVAEMVSEPKPLAPGETIGVQLLPQARLLEHHEVQQMVLERAKLRFDFTDYKEFLTEIKGEGSSQKVDVPVTDAQYAAFGWDREYVQMVEQMAQVGVDPIRSLGYDGPLAALSRVRQNLADYIKESVAVVTNPAIDREREMEHFSTRIVLGSRPSLNTKVDHEKNARLELPSPILIEGKQAQAVCKQFSTLSFEEVVAFFEKQEKQVRLPLFYSRSKRITEALAELEQQAIQAAQNGKSFILLDDEGVHEQDQLFLDPHLAISKVDQALKKASNSTGENLRRQASIVVRSGAMRNLHDIAIAIGLGADAISPYLMFETLIGKENKNASNLYQAINKGLEKIISTIGIHELRGYARLFSSIGLHPEISDVLDIVNYCGSEKAGLSWTDLEKDAEERYNEYHSAKAKPIRTFHLWPRIWKSISQVASGAIPYEEFAQKLEDLEKTNPVSLRHVADLVTQEHSSVRPEEVDLSIGDHDLPLVISSMSFGSQNEVAFRAYAEAADRLNMISLNGEGGEIKDMLGKYPKTRGHQIASGRFGVNVELANSANILEIKIGQGAKPGEGGHLPGKKVSAKVAAARNATPGSDLISPSNNHDIYSIEDLAQIITELKTVNRHAKVIVKVPVVPNIGTIAVGIAKAGADIITLSGFDGGTGAARVHALQHVGLPAEIGVKAAHNALIEAGLRNQVELWADGGLRSAMDVIKLMLLGANRIGFGTLAMLAIGCTTCRGCHLDTCHVGIATQIESIEEAQAHGLRRFVPRDFDQAVSGLIRLFTAIGEEMKKLVAQLGFKRAQDLVGRSDLLKQTREQERIDLSDLLDVLSHEWKQEAIEDKKVKVLAGTKAAEENAEVMSFHDHQPIVQTFTGVNSADRVLISDMAGDRVRHRLDGSYRSLPKISYTFTAGSVPGNGFASFHADGIQATVYGGAQDGVAKMAFGGRVAIMKAPGKHRQWINGSVGKGFCYGAQKGLFIVQGNADSRAGIRLSGADIIIAGEITEPLRDDLGLIGNRANIKGFAFEYMTDGRAVVLGDPGPWICSGMTGGVVYLRLQPEMGLDESAIRRRIAKAAKVTLEPLSSKGISDLTELLGAYHEELIQAGQTKQAEKIESLLQNLEKHFIQVIPVKQQADPSISTE